MLNGYNTIDCPKEFENDVLNSFVPRSFKTQNLTKNARVC